MSGPDALSQTFGTVLLAMAFSAFILFVRGYRPAGVSGLWYDLVLAKALRLVLLERRRPRPSASKTSNRRPQR